MREVHFYESPGPMMTIIMVVAAILVFMLIAQIYRTFISPTGRAKWRADCEARREKHQADRIAQHEKQQADRIAQQEDHKRSLKGQIKDLDHKIERHESARRNLSSKTDMYWFAGQELPKLNERRKLLVAEFDSIEFEQP